MAAERTMISGFGNHHTNKDGKMPYTRITLTDVRKLVDTPQQVDKSAAQWLIPSSLESRVHAEQAKDGQFWALWADVDWKETPPKPMGAVASYVAALTEGADYEVYASRGATEDRQKCRILIPLGEPLCGSDWIDGQRELNALLAEAGIEPDTASERTGQLCYLPNRGQWYDTISRRDGALFDPMTAWSGLIADRRRIEAEQAETVRLEREKAKQRKESIKSSQVGNGAQSLIEVFNQAFHVADILVQAGYDQRGDTFRHPNSETGSFSASVKDGRVHTLSSADPLWTNGEGAHDAFSAFCALFHQGDMPRALRDAGDNWITIGSESWNQVHRRKFAEDRKAERELDEFQAGPNPNTPPPVATDAMFYGIVGEVGRAAAQDTEVNPVAAAAAFLSYLSAQVGRDTYLPVGNTFHHSRLFTCHVGRSGRGRKGDAVSLIHRIRSRIEEVHTLEKAKYHGGGLSTREGLALLIHDGYTQGKTEVPPEDDKRLWIVENEFANVLHQSKRDGNTLSAALRDAGLGSIIAIGIATDDYDPVVLDRDPDTDTDAGLLRVAFDHIEQLLVAATPVSPTDGERLFKPEPYFVGHNVSFDLGFIWRRAVINGIAPPFAIPSPDEIRHGKNCFCTMQGWAGYGQRISLSRLARALRLPDPKQNEESISGANAWQFWRQGELDVVQRYCSADVMAARSIFHRQEAIRVAP